MAPGEDAGKEPMTEEAVHARPRSGREGETHLSLLPPALATG